MSEFFNQQKRFLPVAVGALSVLVLYVLTYLIQPFSDEWNLFLLDMLIVVGAMWAAWMTTRVYFVYDAADRSRSIWGYFSIGMWLWAVAELVWLYFDIFGTEVPNFTVADFFWLAGYIFFAVSMQHQYRVIFQPEVRYEPLILFAGAILVIAISAATTLILGGELNLVDVTPVFYVVADLLVGCFAVYFVYLFRASMLGRAWISLLVFAVADAIYAFTTADNGLYWQSMEGNLVRLFVDGVYLLAYLVLMLFSYGQYRLLNYGLEN